MAVVNLATQSATETGAAIVPVAASADGHRVKLDRPGMALYVNNGSGSPVNVTVVVPGTVLGQALADVVVAVPAGAWRLIKLADAEVDPDTGLVTVTTSAQTSVTLAAVEV